MYRTALTALLALVFAGCGDEAPGDAARPPPARVSAEPGPLARQLKAKADEFGKVASDELKSLFGRASKELATSGLLEKAKNVGGSAVDFELKDANGMPVSLASLRKQGPVVVAFYRGKW